MKVLFYRYGSICEPDIIEQFHNIGLEVSTMEKEITQKQYTSAERIDDLSAILSKERFIFVFSINFFPSVSDVCEIYKIPYVCWSVDCPVLELFSKSIRNKCNRIFCFDYKQFSRIEPYNPDCIYYLPLGTNVGRWDKVLSNISAADIATYSSDISFVGSLYTEKDPFLNIKNPSEYLQGFVRGLYECQKQIQGTNIIESAITPEIIKEIHDAIPEEFVSEKVCVQNMDEFIACHNILDMHCSSLERIEFLQRLSQNFNISLYTRSNTDCFTNFPAISVKGGVATLTEMPKVFRLSKINLNMTIHSIETGASLRIWDIMGCGGFLLTNYQPELDNYLVPGEDYDYYSDYDDLVEKCHFYLSNDDIRQRIAINGYNKTKKYHTYANRLPELFKRIME